MAGGPSHLETFDHKPTLAEMRRQADARVVHARASRSRSSRGRSSICLGPQFRFRKYGKSGQEISELFPHIGAVADDICIIRSMATEAINHDPAHTFMNTGTPIAGRPSMGSWVTYGLGSEAEDLPGFVVLTSRPARGGQPQPIAARQWRSGFLPSRFQGVQFRGKGDPVLYLEQPRRRVARAAGRRCRRGQRAQPASTTRWCDDPEIATRIAQYEMAFRMQASVPELMDLRGEEPKTLELYGSQPGDGSFAANCLLARRLAERGVRFIQLYHRDWDHHGGSARSCRSAPARSTGRARR